jgi:hypothetical protein
VFNPARLDLDKIVVDALSEHDLVGIILCGKAGGFFLEVSKLRCEYGGAGIRNKR